ncbi:C6 transcription factor [Cordyceps javanica]|uniref:C6 transcription factor n=1 Tax=Cordyceps javanica TaxID=43265 RepID=A0A545V2N7_9HYPO|nr:C6 transcription factor [Cordyceps javanica]TQW06832.1 C6 transcription factor [Cordyceps javanica]
MTPTPPSTNSSTGARSPEETYKVVHCKLRQLISRLVPSLTPFRKCDRKHPCSNCTKREGNDTSSCTYAAPASQKKGANQADLSPDDMQNRIDRLENLVLSLMHTGGSDPASAVAAARGQSISQTTTDSSASAKMEQDDATNAGDEDSDDDDGLTASLGMLKVDADKGKSMYIGHEHWHSILADISDVKNYFTFHRKELESSYERVKNSKPAAAREGPTLLLGAQPASEIELRTSLPPKTHVLALCSRYFNSMDNAVSVIHGPTFLQQLRTHWQDPNKTPIMWLGLLYSILSLAMLSYNKVGDEPPEWRNKSMAFADEYRLRTVQCLVKGDYTKPVDHTVETLLLYVLGEYTSRWDADLGLWLIVGMIARIAIRQGYHRDAKWFPSLSPFQAEMRRRTWALIRMSDIVFSHQVSLPSMINERDCDTQLPNNLFDDDFHQTIKELPPSRPASEPTPISYMIAKAKLCFELGNILQATNRLGKGLPYDEVLRFDAKLRQIVQDLPPHLRLSSLQGSNDPVTLIVARFNVNVLYQKIMCLLHRHYMVRARQNSRYAHSRRAAIQASMEAMGHLSTLHRESQPGGKLRAVSWYVKSIATKEFILPAMLIILDLHYDNIAMQNNASHDADGSFVWDNEKRATMVSSLRQAGVIWSSLADTSMEAFKASKILEIMMDKIQTPVSSSENTPESRNDSISMGVPSFTFDMDALSSDPQSVLSSAGLGDLSSPESNNAFSGPLDTAPFIGMDFGLPPVNMDMSMDGLNPTNTTGGPMSPLSMFTTVGNGLGADGGAADFAANFDWNTFENYTQMASWGADQSFQIYAEQPDQPDVINPAKM